MHFASPDTLRLLFIVVPVFIYLAYKVYTIVRNLKVFFDRKTSEKMIYPVSVPFVIIRYSALFIAFILIIFALARPWGKPIKSEMQLSGIDIMVAVDVSSSMGALDLKPSRMEVVRQGLKEFTASLNGDRIGMITFAGVSFVQCPLTVDYDAYDLIIDSLAPGMLSKDGTALGDAIRACADRMKEKAEKSRIMILITDGESNAGTPPVDAARYAKEQGIMIYTIGVGTEEGGKIPDGQDMFGRTYFKSYEGAEVVTKLNDSELREVAGITGGKFYRATDMNAFRSIKDEMRFMEENKTKKEQITHEENYSGFLLWGLIFFALSQLMTVRAAGSIKDGMIKTIKSIFKKP
jgi:Ca-activated chloride channel family protein